MIIFLQFRRTEVLKIILQIFRHSNNMLGKPNFNFNPHQQAENMVNANVKYR